MKQQFASSQITERQLLDAIWKTEIGSPDEVAGGTDEDVRAVAFALGARRIKRATLQAIREKAARLHEKILRVRA